MELDKNRIYSPANADDAKEYIGMRGWFAFSLEELEKRVAFGEDTTAILLNIRGKDSTFRFRTDNSLAPLMCLFYPCDSLNNRITQEEREAELRRIMDKYYGAWEDLAK